MDRPATPGGIANVEAASTWEELSVRWVEHAARYEGLTRSLWRRFLSVPTISASDRVLDVGCGTGGSTRDAARLAPSGSVVGIDLSARMVERAQELAGAEGLTNVRFQQADAQVHPFESGGLDVVISRLGVMFFADAVAAFANIGRALRPNGRLAALVWRHPAANEWVTVLRAAVAAGRPVPEPPSDVPGPYGLASPDRVRAVLGAAGFAGVELDPVDEPVELGRDADDALEFASGLGAVRPLLDELDDGARGRALEALHRALAAHETAEGVVLGAGAWRITARRP